MGENNSLNIEVKDWPTSIKFLKINSIPKISCLRCMRHKEKFLLSLKTLTIINCGWLISDDFQFIAPNLNLNHLEISNCFRLFEKSSLDTNLSLRFPNLHSLKIHLVAFPESFTQYLENCSAKSIELNIEKKLDFSEQILRLIADRNNFSSDKSGLYKLTCNSELVENLREIINPSTLDCLSIPFVLEILCENISSKSRFESINHPSISTFQIQTNLLPQAVTVSRKRKWES